MSRPPSTTTPSWPPAAWARRAALLALALGAASQLGRSAEAPAGSDRLTEVATSPTWLSLGHYQPRNGGGYVSSVAAQSGFFLAKDGRTDPAAELAATLAALRAPEHPVGVLKQSAACGFPARARFLAKALGASFPPVACPDFTAWSTGLAATGVTVVYSSAYANHPASLFGHALVRLDARQGAKDRGRRQDLLSYGVNFAALTADRFDPLGFRYAWDGLFGGFEGRFAIAPYYLKVNEYNHAESRDLWEYELALTDGELAMVVDHLWELYTAGSFAYYFLDENCAYQLLAWLTVANPDWRLLERLGPIVPPAAVIRVLATTPGLVANVHFRASNRKLMLRQYDGLGADERRSFRAMLAGAPASGDLAPLEMTISYLDYKKFMANGELPSEEKKALRTALVARAALPATGQDPAPATSDANRPDLGHRPASASLGMRRAGGETGMTASFAPGYHRLLSRDEGYEPYAETQYLGLTAEALPGPPRAAIDSLTLLSLTALKPWTGLDPQPSWHAALGEEAVARPGCPRCPEVYGEGGIGFAAAPAGVVAYTFAGWRAERRYAAAVAWHTGPTLTAALLLGGAERWKLRLTDEAFYDALASQKERLSREARLDGMLSLDVATELVFGLRQASGRDLDERLETSFGVVRYF